MRRSLLLVNLKLDETPSWKEAAAPYRKIPDFFFSFASDICDNAKCGISRQVSATKLSPTLTPSLPRFSLFAT
ncbi:hypothetical protein AGROH133_14537 (plasmid) [Agrobacterium tumefaciens]|nr:hypothetical protein AGROH133_14537 [Agrobacterium tumefaciens]